MKKSLPYLLATLLLASHSLWAQSPVLISSSPVRNAESVPRETNVSLTFSQPMSLPTFSGKEVVINGSQTGTRTVASKGSFSGSGTNTLVFDPVQDFKAGEEVSVTVKAKNASQNAQTKPQVLNFTARVTPSTGSFSASDQQVDRGTHTADLDGDLDLDILGGCCGESLYWYRNNGSGHFSERIDLKTEDTGDWSYQVPADFDGDGDVDILHQADLYSWLFRNDGQGNFTQDPIINITAGELKPVDLDNDGDLDIAVLQDFGEFPYLYIHTYINGGQGNFSYGIRIGGLPYQWGDEPWQVTEMGFNNYVQADFDNDGDVDMMGSSGPYYDHVLLVISNDGTGHFPTRQKYIQEGNPIAAQDFNGDGWVDVLFDSNYLGINQQNGTFAFEKLNLGELRLFSTRTGDLNGDGYVDILHFASMPGDSALVRSLFNDGQGHFVLQNQSIKVKRAFPIAEGMADLDDDGDLDMITLTQLLFNQNLSTDQCQASGTILREYWANVRGNQTADVPVNKAPTSTSYLTSFEAPSKVGEQYASRIRGYLCAPETGNYTFWIASDDYGDLYLSSDDKPANKQRIAYIKGWSNPRQWNKHYSQKSALVYLEKGKRYYIEALHKEGWVNDNLAVAWRVPSAASFSAPVIIPGSVLSPFVPSNARLETAELANAEEVGLNLQAAPNPFSHQTTVTFKALESGSVLLDLYDLQGRQIQHVFDGQMQAGEKQQVDVNGNQLGQGLYLLRLVNGSQVRHLKLMLSK